MSTRGLRAPIAFTLAILVTLLAPSTPLAQGIDTPDSAQISADGGGEPEQVGYRGTDIDGALFIPRLAARGGSVMGLVRPPRAQMQGAATTAMSVASSRRGNVADAPLAA